MVCSTCMALRQTDELVPKYIFYAPGIPMTINGKKVEIVVKRILVSLSVSIDFVLTNVVWRKSKSVIHSRESGDSRLLLSILQY